MQLYSLDACMHGVQSNMHDIYNILKCTVRAGCGIIEHLRTKFNVH